MRVAHHIYGPDDPRDLLTPPESEPHYATSLLGVVEPCVWCGNDIDDHTGLCATCTRWVNREPFPGYDRPGIVGYDGWQG